jgi:hypothetical protein
VDFPNLFQTSPAPWPLPDSPPFAKPYFCAALNCFATPAVQNFTGRITIPLLICVTTDLAEAF